MPGSLYDHSVIKHCNNTGYLKIPSKCDISEGGIIHILILCKHLIRGLKMEATFIEVIQRSTCVGWPSAEKCLWGSER